jgi:hypothetical protein
MKFDFAKTKVLRQFLNLIGLFPHQMTSMLVFFFDVYLKEILKIK